MKGIKPILEHVLIQDGWNIPAIICKDGTVYVMLKSGSYMTRTEWLECDHPMNEDQNNKRLAIFDKLDEYYLTIKP